MLGLSRGHQGEAMGLQVTFTQRIYKEEEECDFGEDDLGF
jgi:hypothetical protein